MDGIIAGGLCVVLAIGAFIMKKTDLITVAGINPNILARLGKGEYVSMESLHKICKAFNCDVGDICEMKEEN